MSTPSDNPDPNCEPDVLVSRPIEVVEDIARKFEQTLRVQRALFRISSIANNELKLEAFYEQVHDVIRELTCAEYLFIASVNHEDSCVSFPYFVDKFAVGELNRSIDLASFERFAITSVIIESRELVHVDKSEHIQLRKSRDLKVDVATLPEDWLGVPLVCDDQVVGALVIQSYEPGFRYNNQDESTLLQISQHVGTAINRQRSRESLQATRNQLEENNQRLKRLLSERKEIHKKLKFNANHDPLTSLPNRAMFLRQLLQTIKHAQREPSLEYALLYLDLDRFKVVNDSLGHLVGDLLLVEVASRLKNCIRPSDMVARLGGDEFCVLLRQDATQSVVDLVSQRILKNLSQPMQFEDQRVVTGTSIGVAFGHSRYKEAEEVLRDADTALYDAKSRGKSMLRVFDRSMREQAVERLKMEQELRVALEEREISVHYQPIVKINSGKVVAFEALARWNHHSMGNVPAGKFIPMAEELQLIHTLTMSVVRQAAKQVSHWREEIPDMEELGLSVNVSSRVIENIDFAKSVQQIMNRVKLPTRFLTLEITESLLQNNLHKAKQVLGDLNSRQVRLALDDFGTGYSSLSSLNSLPLDVLKIDLSFVKNIVEDSRSYAIVKMIVALAAVMDLKVVAEGVEDEAQLCVLGDLGVNYVQGYLFGEPASATTITRRLCETKEGVFLPGIGNPVWHQTPNPTGGD